MKKIIVTLAVLLLAAPVMADVTITCTETDANEITVSFATSSETERVRALALDIQLDDANAVIENIECVSAGYNIHPTNIEINSEGEVDEYGSCAVDEGDDQNDTTEQGSLYEGDNYPAEGDLFIITLSGCGDSVGVSVSENALRGGIVMEDANGPDGNVNSAGIIIDIGGCGCQCWGDIAGPTGGPDGLVSTSDLGLLMSTLGPVGSPYVLVTPVGLECMDVSGPQGCSDGNLSTSDLGALMSYLGPIGSPYIGACMPDPPPCP